MPEHWPRRRTGLRRHRREVIVLDIDVKKLRMVDAMFGGKVSTMMANEYNLNRVVGFADVLLGAVLHPGQPAPF